MTACPVTANTARASSARAVVRTWTEVRGHLDRRAASPFLDALVAHLVDKGTANIGVAPQSAGDHPGQVLDVREVEELGHRVSPITMTGRRRPHLAPWRVGLATQPSSSEKRFGREHSAESVELGVVVCLVLPPPRDNARADLRLVGDGLDVFVCTSGHEVRAR